MTADSTWRLDFQRKFSDIERDEWQRCAGEENPFVGYDFLASLEASGCLGPRSGWIPHIAVLRDSLSQQIQAVAPSFLKLHSKGEYMFDYHWAEAYSSIAGSSAEYYPKLQVAVPFSPVPGPRLLVNKHLPHPLASSAREALLDGLRAETTRLNLSGLHLTFCQSDETEFAQKHAEFLTRTGEQYHWSNRGYQNFEDFLKSLNSRKRKQIRRERRKAQEHPLKISTVHGDTVSPVELEGLYELYVTTSLRKWGQPYLNRDFFIEMSQRLGEKLVLFLVRRDSDQALIAGAWNLRGSTALFGRNWGTIEQYDCLHFEVCYYRAIEYAIQNKLERVEAGAQGTHKIQRGYTPVVTHACHHFLSGAFTAAVSDYLEREKADNRRRIEVLRNHTPYRVKNEQMAQSSHSCFAIEGAEAEVSKPLE